MNYNLKASFLILPTLVHNPNTKRLDKVLKMLTINKMFKFVYLTNAKNR